MKIGNRYVDLYFLYGVVFAIVFETILFSILFKPNLSAAGLILLLLIPLPPYLLYSDATSRRCPNCKHLLTAEKLRSKHIGSKTEDTLSCVNCGEEWVNRYTRDNYSDSWRRR
jgi:hypothetical protein